MEKGSSWKWPRLQLFQRKAKPIVGKKYMPVTAVNQEAAHGVQSTSITGKKNKSIRPQGNSKVSLLRGAPAGTPRPQISQKNENLSSII
eukprot:6184172-Pleurochrysis_carterae.AAC.1